MTWKDAMIYIASIKWYMEERVEATKEYYDALDIALASMCSVSRDTVAWYNKLHTDSAEYRMWGNGIALPTALYVMQGIAEELTNDVI